MGFRAQQLLPGVEKCALGSIALIDQLVQQFRVESLQFDFLPFAYESVEVRLRVSKRWQFWLEQMLVVCGFPLALFNIRQGWQNLVGPEVGSISQVV